MKGVTGISSPIMTHRGMCPQIQVLGESLRLSPVYQRGVSAEPLADVYGFTVIKSTWYIMKGQGHLH